MLREKAMNESTREVPERYQRGIREVPGITFHAVLSVVVLSAPLGGCGRCLVSAVVALSSKSAQRGAGTPRGDDLLREGGEGRVLAPA